MLEVRGYPQLLLREADGGRMKFRRRPRIIFEIDSSLNGEYYWRIVARNEQIVGTSGETYKRKSHARAMARMIGRQIEAGSWKVTDRTEGSQ